MAKMLVEEFKGIVPSDIKELQKLPGVGRKTANVIASVVYDKPAMAVDTHVFRVSNRIGLTVNSKTPLETEKELTKHIPKSLIPIAHHWLILHGRYVCTARNPKCESCGLKPCVIIFCIRNEVSVGDIVILFLVLSLAGSFVYHLFKTFMKKMPERTLICMLYFLLRPKLGSCAANPILESFVE
mgnify:CR=1 FL=1